MANAKRDENHVPTLLGVSNLDGVTPITVYADPVTHRLLVDAVASEGVVSINTDETSAQTLAVGTAGTDFAIVDNLSGTHTFNLPTASASNRGALSSADWSAFNSKGDGTVTQVSVATANGFSGTVASDTTTPSITIDASGLSAAKIANGSVSNAEFQYLDGVTSSIQTQINAKAPSTAPTFATSITGSYLTASEILITDASKNIVSAGVATYPSLTELSYVKGVTSAIQTQIETKVTGPASSTDNAIARFDGTTGKLLQDSVLTIGDPYNANTRFRTEPNVQAGAGMDWFLRAGASTDNSGGLFQSSGGAAGGGDAVGGGNNMIGGAGNGSGAGGASQVLGGIGGVTGAGGNALIQGGAGGETSGNGGPVLLVGGSATAGNGNGADVLIAPGSGNGSGTHGSVVFVTRNGLNAGASFNLSNITSTYRIFTLPDQAGIVSTTTSGTGVPSSTPASVGQIYIKTDTKKVYVSCGTSSSADWIIVN